MDALVEYAKKIWAVKMIRMMTISVGIILCFLWFGIMQEEVTRGCWGGEIVNKTKCINHDPFEYELTFVGILTLWYAVVAGGKIHTRQQTNRKLQSTFTFAFSHPAIPITRAAQDSSRLVCRCSLGLHRVDGSR